MVLLRAMSSLSLSLYVSFRFIDQYFYLMPSSLVIE